MQPPRWHYLLADIIILTVILLLLPPLFATEETAFRVQGEQKMGDLTRYRFQPMTSLELLVAPTGDAPTPSQGEVQSCYPYNRVIKVVETDGTPAIIHEMALKCRNAYDKTNKEYVYVVKGVKLP